MNWKLAGKIGTILLLLVLLSIPMMRIRNLIGERQALRNGVVADIERSSGYAQAITGPIVVVPYTRTVREWQDTDTGRREVFRTVPGRLHLLPSDFSLDGNLTSSELSRGIYRARVFSAATTLRAVFELPAYYGLPDQASDYKLSAPLLAVGITDIRGIGNGLSLVSGDQRVDFVPGTGTPLLTSGVHAPLMAGDVTQAQRFEVEIKLDLQGTSSFSVTPVGRETRVALTSDWPHPSFIGEFLPREREVTSNGFAARWQTSFFATNLEGMLEVCAGADGDSKKNCSGFEQRQFGVSFIDPVDQYAQSDRATKYAFLFTGLAFASFFLCEVLRRKALHPVHYGLVGLSLAVFFLLLIALAEHTGFGLAYLLAAVVSVALNTYYLSQVLKSPSMGIAFGSAQAVMYGLLYGILRSEDYALLMGSLLVFAVLGTVMVLTRHVNWGEFGGAKVTAE
ncbi:MAG: cell envelope integrity protein CreD [Nevskiaceae bacterium]|jgi:inner membrane protein|nr:cell envelope integrity protein CreD [Nevskiaceae bacterium]